MAFDCGATVQTGANGELLCVDGVGAAVAWTSTPEFTLEALDGPTVALVWGWGFGAVVLCWGMAHALGIILKAIRRF